MVVGRHHHKPTPSEQASSPDWERQARIAPATSIPRRVRNPLDHRSHNWEHRDVKVFGETVIAGFAKKHPAPRQPLQRFATIARSALWLCFPAVEETFPAADHAPATGTLAFNIGGNKYRLIARVDFEEQLPLIETVPTHREYGREDL
jgi:mRNA interferase HigB